LQGTRSYLSMENLCIPYISLIEFRENVIISLPVDSWIHITFFLYCL
jgi:hypothetical protein